MTEHAGFQKLNRAKRAYEEVANQIRAEILQGHLKLSDRLPTERELAEQVGVSRVVVREAIRTLELSGFLKVRSGAGGGVFVAQDYDRPIVESITNLMATGEVKFEDLFTVRMLVESYAVEHLARHGTMESFQQLRDLLEEAEQARKRGENIRSYNIRYHRLIVRMCENYLLTIMGEIALTMTTDHLSSVASKGLSRTHFSLHTEILQALMARDAVRAKQIVEQDIRTLQKVLADKNSSPKSAAPSSRRAATARATKI